MAGSYFARVVGACCRHAWLIAIGAVLLGMGAGLFTAQNFAINSDTAELISPDLPWRQRQIAFDKQFPQQDNLILAVVDGETPERTEAAATALATNLSARPELFESVRRPDATPFFQKNGLLFMPTEKVRATTEQLVKAQPFLGPLAADPSLRGIMNSLSTALLGVEQGQASLSDLKAPLENFASVLSKVERGQQVFMSWQSLLGGGDTDTRQLRHFILVKPRLNYGDLSPGANASHAIRDTARALNLTPEQGVQVRLTGQIPLADEEFASLKDHVGLILSLMLAAVLFMLWMAVNSARIIAAILVTLFIGLAVTTALGLLATGGLNLISVAFIPLFVGLGVDFGIQYSVRYRAERHARGRLQESLVAAGGSVGLPLALAAIAVAAGFLAFVPTDYLGVAELGLIAGIGMIVAFVLSLTVLPALLMLLKPRGEADEVGNPRLAVADHFLQQHRKAIAIAAAVLAVVGAGLLTQLHFDFNPLHLRNPKSESVATLLDLMKDPLNAPNTIDILAPSLDAAEKTQAKLSALPEVAQVLTLKSFIPDDQDAKLALISDAAMLLDTTINPFFEAPPPSDADTIAALRNTVTHLRKAAATAKGPASADALNLAAVLERLANGSKDTRLRAGEIMVPPLKIMLTQVRNILQAQKITLDTMPKDMVHDWIAPDGRARIQVFPSGNADSNANLRNFARAVRAIAPDATGAAISIQESGNTIVGAFTKAGIGSFIAVTILLFIALRRVRVVAMAVASLVLAGILTMASCVVLGLQINFANIIALPLLFGIGVAFNIYYLMAWRSGDAGLLQSPLARAILFSALTTASGFGSLWLSSHPGTASMGELLMLSLAWTIISTLFFLPSFLGPAPQKGAKS